MVRFTKVCVIGAISAVVSGASSTSSTSLASETESATYLFEAPACAAAFDARITATSCKADKLSVHLFGAAVYARSGVSTSSFPSKWTETMMESLQSGYDSCTE